MFDLIIRFFDDAAASGWFAVFGGWVDPLLNLVTSPFEFGWLSALMTEFQGIAIAVVFVIVVARGITSGILLTGGSQDESVGHYLFTSFVPIALIAATPAIVGAVCQATTAVASAVAGETIGAEMCTGLIIPLLKGLTNSPILCIIVCIAVIYYIICITLQCVKRWVLLEVLSVISPLVCITTATEDSGSYVTLLKSMFATGLITALQILLVYSAAMAPDFGNTLALSLGSNEDTLVAAPDGAAAMKGLFSSASVVLNYLQAALNLGTGQPSTLPLGSLYGAFISIAILSAAKNAPAWIERYTDTVSMPGRGGIARGVSTSIRTANSAKGLMRHIGARALPGR